MLGVGSALGDVALGVGAMLGGGAGRNTGVNCRNSCRSHYFFSLNRIIGGVGEKFLLHKFAILIVKLIGCIFGAIFSLANNLLIARRLGLSFVTFISLGAIEPI